MGRPEDILAHFFPYIFALFISVLAVLVLSELVPCRTNRRIYDQKCKKDTKKKQTLKDALREVIREEMKDVAV